MYAAGLLALAAMMLPLPSGEMPHAEAAGGVATAAGAEEKAERAAADLAAVRRMTDVNHGAGATRTTAGVTNTTHPAS
ncbi:MAG: hypothetical protein ACYC5Q_16130 [Thermoleophilia bacterium]